MSLYSYNAWFGVQQTPAFQLSICKLLDPRCCSKQYQLPCDWSYLLFPALLFGLIVVWPSLIEFWVDCCCRNVGLSFCPLQERIWQKWFSTQSWLTMEGFITEFGNLVSLIVIRDWKPRHIDWRSNHSLLDTNSFLFSLVWASHSTINL